MAQKINSTNSSNQNNVIIETSHPVDGAKNSSVKKEAVIAATTTTDNAKPSGKMVLERLARQVEYYFSTTNLEKDTYLSTLRSLNDGYVPLSILANFGKVKALVPYDAMNAVRNAATECSSLLEVVYLEKLSGKRSVDIATLGENNGMLTMEAVGPKSGFPIPMSSIQSPVETATNPAPASTSGSLSQSSTTKTNNATSSPTPIQNTIIIREVPESIQEKDIRDLFQFDKCPPIQSLHLDDIVSCWFVTLDTKSRDDMIHVMFQLRSKKFPSGDNVKARLKSAVVITTDVPPPMALMPTDGHGVGIYNDDGYGVSSSVKKSGSKKKKGSHNKKSNSTNDRSSFKNSNSHLDGNKRGKSNIGNNSSNNNNNNNDLAQRRNDDGNSGPGSKHGKKNNTVSQSKSTRNARKGGLQNPPTLNEDHFPSLPSEGLNKNKVELEKVPEHQLEDDNMMKANTSSDSASTVTTTSSSSSTKNNIINPSPTVSNAATGGYAAALLKEAPATLVASSKAKTTVTKSDKKDDRTPKGSGNSKSRNGYNKKNPAATSGTRSQNPWHKLNVNQLKSS